MKPLKLKMRAFGPYIEKTEIDFEKGLGGSNFFLIHGATGSGKTTILDAISYALYNKCSGEKRTGEMMRSQNAKPVDKTEVDFTFSLDGKIYRVIRCPKYQRPSFRGGTSLVTENATVEIFVDGKSVPAEKIDGYFQKILHFDEKQFRQVVMLPQGDFRKFLMASSVERTAILNVIFNASLYKAVEDNLKDEARFAKQNFDNLNERRRNFLSEAKTIAEVDDDNFNEDSVDELSKKLADEIKNLAAEIEQLQKISNQAAANLADGKTLHDNFQQFDKSFKHLQTVKVSLADALKIFDSAQIEYDARKSEEPKRRELESKINELQKIQAAVDALKSANEKLSAAEKSERDANAELKMLEERKVAFEGRINLRKEQVEKFTGADVKFKDAEQKLKDALDKADKLNNLAKLKKDLSAAENRLAIAKKNLNDAQVELERLRTLQKLGSAAQLAEGLKDGEPCPVCGSTVHPHIAVSEEVIPTDEEIERVDNILKRRQVEKDSADRSVSKITGNIESIEDALKNFADTLTVDNAQKNFEAAKRDAERLDEARNNLKKGEELTEKLYKTLDEQRIKTAEAVKIAANLRGIVSEKKSQIPAEYLKDVQKISTDLKVIEDEKSKLDKAFTSAEKKLRLASDNKSKLEGELKTAENVHKDAAAKVEGKVKPNIAELEQKADDAQKKHLAKFSAANDIKINLKRVQKISMDLKILSDELSDAENISVMWKKLSDTANGKLSFQRYYLNSMFKEVITAANRRLEKMSCGRYQFHNKENDDKRKSAGLDLEIFDSNSAKYRAVETLSGGESFLASLSLALGLAAVVKNTAGGIKLDTIFIDEGFGSLDSETLDDAINTLIDLQSDGRLVGIISHVEELKQRIPNRLEVVKHKDGSTAYFAG